LSAAERFLALRHADPSHARRGVDSARPRRIGFGAEGGARADLPDRGGEATRQTESFVQGFERARSRLRRKLVEAAITRSFATVNRHRYKLASDDPAVE